MVIKDRSQEITKDETTTILYIRDNEDGKRQLQKVEGM
jgi:hypothetical protein